MRAPGDGREALKALVEEVEQRAADIPFRDFLAMFFDVTYVVEKQFDGCDALLQAGGQAVARLLERTVEKGEEGEGERWDKRLRVWGTG